MAYETVVCEIHYYATIEYLDSSGTFVNSREDLGDFEDRGDAARALAAAGMTLKEYGWEGNYSRGHISRVLKEIKED